MKNVNRIFLLLMLLIVILTGSVFAESEEFILTKEYSYKNNKSYSLKEGSVEILIGSGDFVKYQDDLEFTISPVPDEIKEDEYGNKYAYYNLAGLNAGSKFNVTVKRKFIPGTYLKEIPQRTNTEFLKGFEKYIEPQEKIDSENDEIVAKAKELTEDMASDYKKAEAIFKFVNVNMSYNESASYANKGSISALKTMKGVCEEFTTLFIGQG